MSSPTSSHPRILLLTHPRSASNLLVRILNLPFQSDFSSPPFGGYPFFPAYQTIMSTVHGLYLKPVSTWTEAERAMVRLSYEECVRKLDSIVNEAEKMGKGVFVKDHSGFCAGPVALERLSLRAIRAEMRKESGEGAEVLEEEEEREEEDIWTITQPTASPSQEGSETPTHHNPLNTTPLPDPSLLTWTPTFLIRHPALAYPSYHRALNNKTNTTPMHKLAPGCTLAYTRSLYEFFSSRNHTQQPPILLAASDIINPNTSPALLSHYCNLIGLDATKLTYTWSAATSADLEKMPDVAVLMTKSLQASQGVLREKGGDEDVDVDVEVAKWKEEFGVERAGVLEVWCRESLGDWEWLWERRLRVPEMAV